jgi:hypothetical protein
MSKKNKNTKPWTPEENAILRDYYYTLRKSVLLKVLPGRSINDIVQQVVLLEKSGQEFRKEI